MNKNTFQPFTLDTTGLRADLSEDEYPTAIYSLDDNNLSLPEGATYFGIVTSGTAFVSKWDNPRSGFYLETGQYFVIEGPAYIADAPGCSQRTQALVIARLGYIGYPQIGGPVERTGRLRYIDGCSDTLLVCPPLIGEPCLNHLHIPANTCQTQHTHPSQRIGVILRGSGYCLTPWEGELPLQPGQTVVYSTTGWMVKTPLVAGMGWWIPTGLKHSFHTGEGETLDVIAWHPDSDFGPTHANHPMINRSYVEGTSAALIPQIQTQERAG